MVCNSIGCTYQELNKSHYVSHIYNHLRHGDQLKCPFINDCKSSNIFKKLDNMKMHFFRKHFHIITQIDDLKNEISNIEVTPVTYLL